MLEETLSGQSIMQCCPRVQPHVECREMRLRGETWTVLQNSVNGLHVRLNQQGAAYLAQMDGRQSIAQIIEQSEDREQVQEDVGELLKTLCASDMLDLRSATDEARLFQQSQHVLSASNKQKWLNPLALKINLHNPDRWLNAANNKLGFVFTQSTAWLIALLMLTSLLLTVVHFDSVVAQFKQVAQQPQHWWLYGALYPLLKVVHEFAHALCIKRWGGAVHETGISFLVLMPVPYVNASDSWFFEKKYQRIIVCAAGILAECSVACVGFLLWLVVEPGFISNLCFAVFMLGSLSTVLFNANPLLRFDGYYLLQDYLEIPNLGSRANRYYRYLARRYILSLHAISSPDLAVGERQWLLVYGALAFLYRMLITIVIALYLASKFLFAGVLLGAFALYQFFGKPFFTFYQYIKRSPELEHRRQRVATSCVGAALLAFALVSFIPLPASTRTEGVVWVPEQAQVFSNEAGFVAQVLVEAGEYVKKGQQIVQLQQHDIGAEIDALRAKIDAAEIVYRRAQTKNLSEAQRTLSDISQLKRQFDELSRKQNGLAVYAQSAGQFTLLNESTLQGRYVKQGELLAYVVNREKLVVRAVVPQYLLGRVQQGVISSSVRLADRFSQSVPVTFTQLTPAASNELPSLSLAYDGFDGIAVASQADNQWKTLERVFHIELALPDFSTVSGIGGRAYVSLNHAPESLGVRWWRSARQLLLTRLNV